MRDAVRTALEFTAYLLGVTALTAVATLTPDAWMPGWLS